MHLANALLAVGIAANVRASALDRHQARLRFLDRALQHDEPGWGRVLDELVMEPPGRPPHADALAAYGGAPAVPRPAADGAPISARSVVTVLAYEYRAVGSCVRYAVAVLQRAFMCFTARHVAFQLQYVSLLLVLQRDPLVAIAVVAGELKDHLARAIDKLAVANADLSLVLRTYWQTIAVMRHDVAGQLRMDPLPSSVARTVDRLYRQFVDYTAHNCSAYEPSLAFFDDIGVTVNNTLIVDRVLNTTLTAQELMDVGHAHSEFLKRFYADLNYDHMSETMWRQVFYSSNRAEPMDELDKINPPINK